MITDELIERGRKNGHLTFDEVYFYIEKNHLTEAESEKLFDMCVDNDIVLCDDDDVTDETSCDDNASSVYNSSLSIYMSEARKIPMLSKEKQRELLIAYRTGSGEEAIAARNRLVESNLPLVISVAKRYRGTGLSFEDLIQEGNIGLIQGIDKFDISRDVAISTYVTFWIRQRMSRAIADTGNCIRVPVMAHAVMDRIRRFSNRFELSENREPSVSEIAQALGLSEAKVTEYMTQANNVNVVSLDAPVGDSEDTSLVDMLADSVSESPMDTFVTQSLTDTISSILDGMCERDRFILIHRFGLNGNEPMTLEQIGQALNLTRERVRQLEIKMLRRLRSPKYAHLLKDFIE